MNHFAALDGVGDELQPAGLGFEALLGVDVGLHGADVGGGVVGGVFVVETSDGGGCGGGFAGAEEPAGGLGDPVDAEEDEGWEEELEANGEAVGEGGVDVDHAAVDGGGDDLGYG